MTETNAIEDVVLNRLYAGELELRENCGSLDWYAGLWTHVQRGSTRPLRDVMRAFLAQHVRWYTRDFDIADPDMNDATKSQADSVRDQGFAWLQLPEPMVETIIDSLRGTAFHGVGTDETFRFDRDFSTTGTTTLSTMAGEPRANILEFPEITKLAGNKHLLRIARDTLGALPRLSGMAVTLNQAGKQGNIPSSDWHFDKGPIAALKTFIYLNEVTTQTGPHAFVPGTQNSKFVEKSLAERYPDDPDLARRLYDRQRWSQDEMDAVFPDRQIIHTGPAGLAIIEDTNGFHRATQITSGHRLMITLEWALDPTPAGGGTKRIPFDQLPEAIRPAPGVAEDRFRYIFSDFLE